MNLYHPKPPHPAEIPFPESHVAQMAGAIWNMAEHRLVNQTIENEGNEYWSYEVEAYFMHSLGYSQSQFNALRKAGRKLCSELIRNAEPELVPVKIPDHVEAAKIGAVHAGETKSPDLSSLRQKFTEWLDGVLSPKDANHLEYHCRAYLMEISQKGEDSLYGDIAIFGTGEMVIRHMLNRIDDPNEG